MSVVLELGDHPDVYVPLQESIEESEFSPPQTVEVAMEPEVREMIVPSQRDDSAGDSRVLHCAFLLRTNFASSAPAHERVRVQNIRDFLQTKLDSEIKANFLLNEHGDPHFLLCKFNENNIRNN